MKLFEFVDDNPVRINLISVLSQLKERIKSSDQSEFRTDDLIELLRDNEVYIDREGLTDLVTREPLNNIIKNINGDVVQFVGVESDSVDSPDKSESERTVKNMAKRAIK